MIVAGDEDEHPPHVKDKEKEKKKVVLKGSLASVNEARLMTDGKLVTTVDQVLGAIVKKLKSEMGKRYKEDTPGQEDAITESRKKDMTAISSWKKKLKNVKGLSRDVMQQLSQLPTPVITSLINQIGMIVAQKEELGKNADAGDYIDDFRKSDAPQFKGKSDAKIRKMAIAAYLDAKDKK